MCEKKTGIAVQEQEMGLAGVSARWSNSGICAQKVTRKVRNRSEKTEEYTEMCY